MLNLDQISQNLYISGVVYPEDLNILKEHGITAIVNLMSYTPYDVPENFKFFHYPRPDGLPYSESALHQIYEFIDANIKSHKILVHCAAGLSRSGGIVIGWILLENPEWGWEEAHEFVSRSHLVFPATAIKNSIINYVEKNRKRLLK